MVEIKDVALVIRKTTDGNVIIFGKGLNIPDEVSEDGDYLFLGDFKFDAKHIFKDYKTAPGDTPDNMLLGDGLNHRYYAKKIK